MRAEAREPNVDEVRRVALKVAGLDRTPNWSARARWRHLLPELSVTAGQTDQHDDNVQFEERLTLDGDERVLWDSARNQNRTTRRFRTDYTIRAELDLHGLIFDSHELAAAREVRATHDARRKLVQEVHDVYFQRLAAVDELRLTDPRAIDSRMIRARRIQELEADLNGLTDGWFGRQLRGAP